MEPHDVYRVLTYVVELESKIPDSIEDGSLERALRDLAEALSESSRPTSGLEVVRRPFSDISTEVRLLSEMAMALRLRMLQTGRKDVSGLGYFNRRLDQVIEYLAEGSRGGLARRWQEFP